MREISFWKLVENSPEWVGVFTTTVFALVTTAIIFGQYLAMKAQVRVMLWQGKLSARHERQQNSLLEHQNKVIRYQFEYARLNESNNERKLLLALGRKIYETAHFAAGASPSADAKYLHDLRVLSDEVTTRENVLSVSVYSGKFDAWYENFLQYTARVEKALLAERTTQPSADTKMQLREANAFCLSKKIFAEIENAIAFEFRDVNDKWDALTRVAGEL
jgi:hypothetical protein